MTFSIAAHDPDTGAVGVAVASKFLAVGSIVPWARGSAGAVATQAYANPTYGPQGLNLLEADVPAREVVDSLVEEDDGAADRQLGVVDAHGGSAAWTGGDCLDHAGHRVGTGYTCQGNILTGPDVLEAMADAYEAAQGDLPERLLAALHAGDRAGGDRRGRQSAALYVAREGHGYGVREQGWSFDRWVDLRVDDHPDPVPRLQGHLETWRLYFTPPSGEAVRVEGEVREDVAAALRARGHLDSQEELTLEGFRDALRMENLEERMVDGWRIDPDVLTWLRRIPGGGEGPTP